MSEAGRLGPAPAPPARCDRGRPARRRCARSPATAFRAKAPARSSASSPSPALFALWWVATHFGWIRDIFLPTPERIVTQLRRRVEGRHPGRTPAARAFLGEPHARVRRVPAGLRHRDSGRHRDGRLAHRARHLRPADRVLPAAAAARVPAADRHLVRHRGDGEGHPHLPRVLRAAGDGGPRRRARA